MAILKNKPMALEELRAEPLVRRKIGRGYVGPILKCLLDEGILAVTNGIFWVRANAPRKAERSHVPEAGESVGQVRKARA